MAYQPLKLMARDSSVLLRHERALLEHALRHQWICQDQAQVLLTEKNINHAPLDEILISLQWVEAEKILAFWSQLWGLACVKITELHLDPSVVRLVPRSVAERLKVLPLFKRDQRVIVAVAHAYDVTCVDTLRRYFPADWDMILVLATVQDILEGIAQNYDSTPAFEQLFDAMETAFNKGTSTEETPRPVINVIQAFLEHALERGASDIHFEPDTIAVHVRYRIDGLLHHCWTFHKNHWPRICVRLKLMAHMDIAEQRLPQDGRFSTTFRGRPIDCRVATHPVFHGENMVLRLLDKKRGLVSLESLGYSAHVATTLGHITHLPEGMLILTGPTGCGKTTSLYALICANAHEHINTMTLEEPVEYTLPFLRQTDVREGIKLTFVEGLRSILRQDPDRILIGEIRDEETAQMALRASMTGHQVYTTLHTINAISALDRLLELKLPAGLLKGNIKGIVAQRLLRKLCSTCKIPVNPTAINPTKLFDMLPQPCTLYRPGNCQACYGTGYQGRFAIAEILPGGEFLDAWLAQREAGQFIPFVPQGDFITMRQDALQRVALGETSLEEVARVIGL